MLHAPLTVTTAKLDISLLLKSSPSPPPPATSTPRQSSLSSATTSAPAAALAQPPPPRPVSSHRTSTSSNISTASRYGPSDTPSQVYSQPQRPYLPPIAGPPAPYLSPQASSQPVATHPPAKRPAPTQAHPAASPAKKQSKWTAEEDALIIELRGSSMKWEDISQRLPGRSAISCRLHYQNYLERRSEWDEERKNRLARLYER